MVVAANSDRAPPWFCSWAEVALPVKPTCCGLSGLLSAKETDAVKVPTANGLNVTVIVQLEPAVRLAAQSFDSWKRVGLGPVMEMLLMVSGAAPVSVKAIVCEGGGQRFRGRSLQLKLRLEGMIFAVPPLRVMTALADLLVSATADALRITAELAGSDAGPVNVVAVPLGVLAGLTVPHAGEQLVPFCVSVQLTPPLVGS